MCHGLDTLRQSIGAYASEFDARTLSPAQAGGVVRLCAQIEASAASIKALAAARSAEGTEWQHHGYRSAAERLAHDAGMSPGAAKRALETGRRMAQQPEVASVALAGKLSLEQAAAVSEGVAANPSKAAELIDKAKRLSVPELNDEVARVKAASLDQEQRRRAIHAKRSLRRWTDLDGALQAHIYGHPEDGATLWRMLDPVRRRLNILRRNGACPNETLDALDYDAMITIAAIATGKDSEIGLSDLVQLGLFPQLQPSLQANLAYSRPPGEDPTDSGGDVEDRPTGKRLAGSPIRLMIRVDFDALFRGVPLEDELCEIAGYGPVPVSVIEDLLATDNPFIVGLITKSQTVTGVYHHGRRPNAHQRSALDFLHPTCAAEGCSSRAGLQYDHRVDYAKTRFTAFDLLDRLCPHHHRLKTNQKWALTNGRGKRPFVPPDDPRHPEYAHSAARSAARPPP